MKCKNCGAELNNGKCEYCGSVFVENMYYIPSVKLDESQFKRVMEQAQVMKDCASPKISILRGI